VIIVRFRVQCQPGTAGTVADAMGAVVTASRSLAGVAHFDVGRDVTNPDVLIATEVFEDADARSRQEALPQVADVMQILPTALAAPPEATLFHVSSAESAM
jgi:quinol monooxygenase YgiN